MSVAWRRSPYRRCRLRRATATAAATAAAAAVAVATTLLLLLPPPATALKVIFSNAIPDYPSPGPQYTLALPPPGGAVPPGARPLADADESVDVTLTTPTGQRMRCGVPVERPPGAESPAAAARRKRVAAGGGLFDGIDKLLSVYDGLCFLRLEGWWTYEFCYGSRLVQRHIPRDGEDDTTYVLGLAPPSLARFGGQTSATATDGKPGGDESSTEGDEEVAASSTSPGSADAQPEQTAPPYVHVYNNGTPCDIASETPRQVTIRYLCSTALHGPLATRVTPPGEGTSSSSARGSSSSGGKGDGSTPSTREGSAPTDAVTAHYIAAVREPASCVYELDFVNDAVCAHEAYAQEDAEGGAKTMWCTLDGEGGGAGDGGAAAKGGFRGLAGSRMPRASLMF